MQIHELNNFTGTLGAGAYLAVDDGNDTGKLSTQQLLATTEARIDNIIAGPAPSAEEIVDARLGDDGVTYPSLGDAIRDQVSDLKADLTHRGYGSLSLLTANAVMYIGGYIYTDGTYHDNSFYTCSDFIPVKSGDAVGYYHLLGSANTLVYAFYDSGKNFVSGLAGTQVFQDGAFTAPSDGYIRFTTTTSYLSNFVITPPIKDSRLRSADSNLLNMRNGAYYLNAVDSVDIRTFFLISAENAFIQSGYIDTSGNEVANPDYVRSPYISIRNGQSIKYYHLAGTGGTNVVSFYNSSRTYVSGIVGNGAWSDGTFTATADGYVRFTTQPRYLSYASLTPSISPQEALGFAKTAEHGQYVCTGKVADTLGDSLTQLSYVTGGNKKWQNYLQEWLGLASIGNHGADGTKVSGTDNAMCTDTRINALNQSADIVIVMGGVNDWAQSAPMGDKTYNNENVQTFFGACNVMFRKLTARLQSARIIAFGCTFCYYPNRAGFTDPTGILNNQGLSSVDYSNAMMESARMNGIEHYDIGGNLNVNVSNIANTFNVDGTFYIHPNADGIQMIAAYMTKCLL